jgi:cold shock CspA family protein
MRLQGTIVEWKDDRGFGFIEPEEGGGRVFCHIKAFEVRVRRPMAGDRVTYELAIGSDGRTSAAHVRPVGLEDAAYQSNGRSKFGKDVGQARGNSTRRVWTPAIVVTLLLAAGSYLLTHRDQLFPPTVSVGAPRQSEGSQSDEVLRQAFEQRRSNVQVQGAGVVDRVLSDDNEGSRHQRFILRLRSGQTVLIAHNIDLAPRVQTLTQGDRVEFNGEYEWNPQGGVVHWTHRDHDGRHVGGWLKHDEKTYQ